MSNILNFDKNKPMDLIAIGRAGIDLNPNEINRPLEESITFTRYVGGSPANIAVGTAKLGMKTGFIGRVSDDGFGRYVINYFKDNNIDTSEIVVDKTGAVNGLAFTEIKSPTECGIVMYRDNVADLNINLKDIKEEYLKNSKIFLISGTALAKSPSREAVFVALEYARKNGCIVVFELDYRPYSWQSKEETSIYYNLAAEKCDVIIGTREEFEVMEHITDLGNSDDYKTAKKWFDYNGKLVVIKHGKDGSIAYTKDGETYEGRIFPSKVLKTQGAGDSYASAFIYGLMQDWSIDRCLEFGAASASIVISQNSCSSAMPSVEKIKNYIKEFK
ncbi:5-dehydro-2-deoxygluconokinase [Clostridium aestuarii]|uniref:5-dehydro-2-deoxygluconokinase n=1 Tax=Clostridium aestuarii TaxID=338193 RepID=A0ABT4CW45_9CLOT|nr:5-dehydro-2-deoxygluconokinase [Clostridium aestuarii]MCY6483231.1 5-dehydro-2-deoxygluconokinase [Clostridium aestuarii]